MDNMKNFRTYLFEKVEQRDLKDAAKDTNIRIGAEFEVILEELFVNMDPPYDLEALDDEYNEHMQEMENMVELADTIGEKYLDEYLSGFVEDKVVPSIQKVISKLTAERQQLVDIFDDWATTNKEELEKQANILADNIKFHQALEKEINSKLENEPFDVVYDYLRELLDNSDITVDEELLTPPDWAIDNMNFRINRSSAEFDDFYETLSSISDFDDLRQTAIYDYVREYGETDPIAEITESGFGYSPSQVWDSASDYYEGDTTDSLTSSSKDWDGWESAPFDINKAIVGDYHSSKNYSKWRIETDSSLHQGGVEIISPVMDLQKGLSIIEEMFDWIQDVGGFTNTSTGGFTDTSTGFHINLSYKGKMGKLDLLKLMLFMDEGYVEKQFPNRLKSGYANSIQKALYQDKDLTKIGDQLHLMLKTDVASKFKQFTNQLRTPKDKYFGINIINAADTDGRIEFRYMGGPNYEKDYKKVEAMILRYAYLLRLAADPSYKRKEYLQKLFRLFNKWEESK